MIKIEKRVIFIKIIGTILLIIGLFSLLLIPAELTSFYVFSEGGNNHYEGFGFGSLMFAFIIFNLMVYFCLALLGIPLGIGNLKLKKWGYNLSLACLTALLIIGIAATISILLSFNLLKIINLYQFLTMLIFSLVFLILLPYGLMRFYNNPNTRQLFNTPGPASFFEKQSSNKLTIILLNFFWISIFYLFIFFKGAFPLFGKFIFTIKGTYLLSVAIFVLFILSYMFYDDKKFAKISLIIYHLLLFATFVFTFLRNSTNEFFNLLDLPVYEIENVVPAFAIPAGINPGYFFAILIIIQIYLLSRRQGE